MHKDELFIQLFLRLKIDFWGQAVGALLQLHQVLLTIHQQQHLAGTLGGEGEGGDATIAPRHVDGDGATGADAADGAVAPVVGQGGQQFDASNG